MHGLRCFSRQARAATTRAPSAFNLYVKHRYEETKTFDLKAFSVEYKSVSLKEKEKYNEMAAQAKADFTPQAKVAKKKRVATAYSLFVREKLQQSKGVISLAEVGPQWKALSSVERAPYKERAVLLSGKKPKSERSLTPYFQFVKENFAPAFEKQKESSDNHKEAFQATMRVMGKQWQLEKAKREAAKSA